MGEFKPATINRHLSSLRAIFTWAIEEGHINENPVRVRNLEEPQKAPRSLEEIDYHRLLRAAQKYGSKRDTAIIQILRHTGIRVGELCSLELPDIEISKRKGKVIIRSGKGQRYREVPLNLDARRALKEYRAERPKVNDQHVLLVNSGMVLLILRCRA